VHRHDSGSEEISEASAEMNLLEGGTQDMSKYAQGVRCARRVEDNQDLLLAFAWVLPEEHRQFSLYPFVAHIDGTNSTNKESSPLVTVTGRDALGNQFTALRTFLPNNQAWVFKWLFQTVFPTLLGMDALSRIVMFIRLTGNFAELAVSLINNECAEHAFYDAVGPFVHAEDGNDVFWLEMRHDQESQDTQLGTVPRFKRVSKHQKMRGTRHAPVRLLLF
jgi:MULE transposase domain